MKATWFLDTLLVCVVGFYLLLAPFTKVEELFNMQAVHDILNHGVMPQSLTEYDHMSFPGVVPRTFIGSLALAAVVKAIDYLYSTIFGSSFIVDGEYGQLNVQVAVRAVLGMANILGLLSMRCSVDRIANVKKSSKGIIGACFVLLLTSQFHLNFYSTRTLPNFVCLPLVTYGLSKLIRGDMSGLTWLAFTGVVFRLEVGVFAATIALVSSLVFGQSNLFANVFMMIAGTVVGLAFTVGVDSYFWGKWLVPEFEAFKFNIVSGQAVKWGIEPYGAYFTRYILNFFRPPHVLILALFGFLYDPVDDGKPTQVSKKVVTHPARHSLRILFVSSIIFVAIMSFQPHKEWRFIVYIIPVMTLMAGNGLANLNRKRSQLFAHKALLFIMFGSLVLLYVFSLFMAYLSSYNYPGGEAISFLDTYLQRNSVDSVTVHMDVPACMTGITKFTELHNGIVFDKTENQEQLLQKWNNVLYLITAVNIAKPPPEDLIVYDASHWETLTVVPAFAGVNAVHFLTNLNRVITDEAYRNKLLGSIWIDLQQGQFDTFEAFMRESVVLSDFLYVYKRTAQDAMPVILQQKEGSQVREEEEVLVGSEEPVLNEIEPKDIKEDVNEQINELEEKVDQEAVEDEFPSLETPFEHE